MPSVNYNGQSFVVDGRRVWILAASMEYARIPPQQWADRIADARQAGFNTVVTGCPWIVHEPHQDRFVFEGAADLRRFVELCAQAKLWLILRVGPFIGSGYDGGGLPVWLMELPNMALREGNEPFLERVSRFFRRLLAEIGELQATKRGPLILIQVEDGWTCGNDTEADRYLRAVARIIRENGIGVPLINTNNLWSDSAGTIDTWKGQDNLLPNLRQLRAIQPGAPRLVTVTGPSPYGAWGASPPSPEPARVIQRRVAEVLAAGAQPIVHPFHGGTNFGFLAGRLPGRDAGSVTTAAAIRPPLGEAGARGEVYGQLRRIVMFANHFGHVFADLEPDYQPVALQPPDIAPPAAAAAKRRGPAEHREHGVSVCALRGTGGQVVFVFGNGHARSASLVLDNGMQMPVDLGDQPVGWYVLGADLHGKGRLDYANLCPLAIVDRSIVLFAGPPRSKAFVSIGGTPLEAKVPAGNKPLVLEHKNLTIVICNQKQADATYCAEQAVYVGVAGLDHSGRPRPRDARTRAWAISADGACAPAVFEPAPGGQRAHTRRASSVRLTGWRAASAQAYASGTSPRFASLAGPETLAACGALTGYGWYRIDATIARTGKRLVQAPRAGQRVHLFVDGKLVWILGDGPGAEARPVELRLVKGALRLVALVDNSGRFAEGNDLDRKVGLHGHLYEIKTLRAVRVKQVEAAPVDLFQVRPAIMGAALGQLSDIAQVEWTFTHARKVPVLVDLASRIRGAFMLNDNPLAYHAGDTGTTHRSLLLEPSKTAAMKRGKNVLRFAPDPRQRGAIDDIVKTTTLYECADCLTGSGAWAFAKWEAPPTSAFARTDGKNAASLKGPPCWWRCRFDFPNLAAPLWFDAAGLSKGQVYVNQHNLGRYFTATQTTRAVGPQQRLYLPEAWLRDDRPNEILIFDEHGFAPHKTRIVSKATGDLD